MKTFSKTILVLMAVIAVSLTSCKKDDDGGGGGSTGGEGIVSAKVDGNSFSSLEATSFAVITSQSGFSALNVQGNDANGRAISLQISGFDGVGTYEITDSNVFSLVSYMEIDINNPTNAETWFAPYENSGAIGEVKVSERTDTRVKGTFSFKAKNQNGDQSIKNITDGTFDVKIQ